MAPPNLFIIGAARAGTTSLFDALARHPDVFACPVKEPHFLSSDVGRSPAEVERARRAGRLVGAGTALSAAPPRVGLTLDAEAYLALFAAGRDRAVRMEASTDYLPSHVAPGAMAAIAPGARAVAVLRDPVERAWSHHLVAEQNGQMAMPFRDVIDAELRVLRDAPQAPPVGCVGRGLYARQLPRWQQALGERLLVVLFDELTADPSGTLDRVMRHAGLDAARLPPAPVPHSNRSRALRLGWLNRALTRSGLRDRLLRHMPAGLRRLGARAVFRAAPPPRMPQADRALLQQVYAPDIAVTAGLIGRDLSCWPASARG
jgi:hypothetical protein